MLRPRTARHPPLGTRRRVLLVALSGSFLLLLAIPGYAGARTLYVDKSSAGGECSDSRDADEISPTTPLCTLPRAAALAASGETVLVRAGTYPHLALGHAFTQTVTFKPYATERPELQGVALTSTAREIRIEGFRLTDITEVRGEHIELVRNEMSPHGVVLYGNNNLADGNHVHDLRIVFDKNSTAPRCHSNWRLDTENDQNHDGQYDYPLSQTGGIAPRCGHAFRVDGQNHVIRNNLVRKVPADGVQAYNTTNLLVEGNHFEDIRVQSTDDGGDPLEHPDGAQILGVNSESIFRNNVFLDTRGILPMMHEGEWPTNLRIEGNVLYQRANYEGTSALCIDASAVTGMSVVNNTCWGEGEGSYPRIRIRDGDGAADVSDTSGVAVWNNIIKSYVTGPNVDVQEDYNLIRRYEADPSQTPGSHSITAPPKFVADDPELRLAAGSPGIDAGTSEGAPARDRESHRRCNELTVPNTGGDTYPYFDMGASEFGSASSCIPPPTRAEDGGLRVWLIVLVGIGVVLAGLAATAFVKRRNGT